MHDTDAYGCIVVEGHGSMNGQPLSSPAMIRFGELTDDEYFVAESVARDGITIVNPSHTEPLVMLKHFGPHNAELAADAERLDGLRRDADILERYPG